MYFLAWEGEQEDVEMSGKAYSGRAGYGVVGNWLMWGRLEVAAVGGGLGVASAMVKHTDRGERVGWATGNAQRTNDGQYFAKERQKVGYRTATPVVARYR